MPITTHASVSLSSLTAETHGLDAHNARYVNSKLCLSQDCDTETTCDNGGLPVCDSVVYAEGAFNIPKPLQGALSGEEKSSGLPSSVKDWTEVDFQVISDRRPTARSAKEACVSADVDVDRLYSDLLFELGEFARAGGTAVGAAAVVKRVALAHGVEAAARLPLPRLNRAEQAESGVAGVSRRRARSAVPRGR